MQARVGSALIEDLHRSCRVTRLKAWEDGDVLPVQTAAGITKTMAPRDGQTVDSYEVEIPASDAHDFYRNLTAAIDGRERQRIDNAEVRRVLLVMENASTSAECGQALRVNI